jgi:hypothetical protein
VKHFVSLIFAAALACTVMPAPAAAQLHTMYATTLSAAAAAGDDYFDVTSATNMAAPSPQSGTAGSQLYVVDIGSARGEVAQVVSISSTRVYVQRNAGGARTAHASGAMVLFGPPNWFQKYDPSGGCDTSTVFASPWVNVTNGLQWLCSSETDTWVPGWQNPAPSIVTATVASVAGATAVNGPLQHISGTNAITSFTMGTGWNGSGFCVIPDGAFTTTATNNIAKASTAVANKTLCFAWDATNSKFTPNY